MNLQTPRLQMPLLATGQSQKELTHNQALFVLDTILAGVQSRSVSSAPSSPAEGDAYLVPGDATGIWASHVDQIAYFYQGIWLYSSPVAGPMIHVIDEDIWVQYESGSPSGWVQIPFLVSLVASDVGNDSGVSGIKVKDALETLDAQKIPLAYLDTDGTLAANSDSKIATQKAVKTYVGNAVTGLLKFKGSTDCSANPNYPAASKGDAYVVSVAGKIGGASGTAVDLGDVYVASADNAGGDQATVGSSWFILEHNLQGTLLAANNLSDLASAATARTNLGLGSIATQSASAVALTGGSIDGVTIGATTPAATTVTTLTLTGGLISSSLAGGAASAINLLGEGGIGINAWRYSNDVNAASITQRKARGTIASPSAVLQNDIIGTNLFQGQGSSSSAPLGGDIRVTVIEPTPSATAMATRFSFRTAALGTVSLFESLRVEADTGVTGFSNAATKSSFNAVSARAAIVSGNVVGGYDFLSNDTQLTAPGNVVASVQGIANETHTTTANGTDLIFKITAPTTTTLAEVMRLSSTASALTVTTPQTTLNLFNATAATVNAFGAATAIGLGSAAAVITLGASSIVKVGSKLQDTNAKDLLLFTATASAVNALTLANAATGNAPSLTATGTDTDIGINLVPKGAGTLQYNGVEVGFRTVPQNSQSAAYTLVLSDSGKHILHPSADTTARTFTIPANASVAYPIGTALTFVNENAAGVLSIAITSDTMYLAGAGTTGSRTLAANGIATALKVTSTEWIISGTGLT